MAAHACETCGLLHDMPEAAGESEAVQLARIEAERAIEVARIEAGADRAASRAMVEAAHEEARGEADAAEAQAEIIGDAIEAAAESEDGPDPIEIIAPEPVTGEEPAEDEMPPAEGSPIPEPAHSRSRGIGMW